MEGMEIILLFKKMMFPLLTELWPPMADPVAAANFRAWNKMEADVGPHPSSAIIASIELDDEDEHPTSEVGEVEADETPELDSETVRIRELESMTEIMDLWFLAPRFEDPEDPILRRMIFLLCASLLMTNTLPTPLLLTLLASDRTEEDVPFKVGLEMFGEFVIEDGVNISDDEEAETSEAGEGPMDVEAISEFNCSNFRRRNRCSRTNCCLIIFAFLSFSSRFYKINQDRISFNLEHNL